MGWKSSREPSLLVQFGEEFHKVVGVGGDEQRVGIVQAEDVMVIALDRGHAACRRADNRNPAPGVLPIDCRYSVRA